MFTEFGESLTLQYFREIYSEVLRIKRISAAHRNVVRPVSDFEPEMLKSRFETMFHNHERASTKVGGYFLEPYSDARYAMISLVDEVLINDDWMYRTWWQGELLEKSLNGSYEAGEEFFRRADRILSERRSVEYVETAKVYLLSLLLGFRGKYRYDGGEPLVKQYIAKLYEYIFDKPYHETSEITNLTAESDLHIASQDDVKYFPPSYKRYVVLLLWLGVFLLMTTALWFYLTKDIRRTLGEIRQLQKPVVVKEETKVQKRTSPVLVTSIKNERGEPVQALVTIDDSSGFTAIAREQTNIKGVVQMPLPPNRTLRISLESRGCYPKTVWLTSGDRTEHKLNESINTLESLRDKPIRIENISYDKGSADLTEASIPYLDKISEALKGAPSLHVNITGHTDNAGGQMTNVKLSRERAESVLNHFVKRGLDVERLHAFGKGSAQPVAPNTDNAGRSLNRRVEIMFVQP
ncbi:MAG: DotU family type IV/VI secretion system protein [Candidatus Kapabacteria bacterium]|nr:DotU family type IV/VI secretion system protein [Candidatus Kapabacteria bacterium]